MDTTSAPQTHAAQTRAPSSERACPLRPHRLSAAPLLHFLSACFADGILPLDMEANDLLSDTFEVLSSREIKLLAMRSKPDKDLLMEEDDMALANVVMEEAQKKLISQVSVLSGPGHTLKYGVVLPGC